MDNIQELTARLDEAESRVQHLEFLCEYLESSKKDATYELPDYFGGGKKTTTPEGDGDKWPVGSEYMFGYELGSTELNDIITVYGGSLISPEKSTTAETTAVNLPTTGEVYIWAEWSYDLNAEDFDEFALIRNNDTGVPPSSFTSDLATLTFPLYKVIKATDVATQVEILHYAGHGINTPGAGKTFQGVFIGDDGSLSWDWPRFH